LGHQVFLKPYIRVAGLHKSSQGFGGDDMTKPEDKCFWRTSVTYIEPNKILVRGYRIEDLMENLTFGEAVYLILRGELPPTKGHGKMMNAILTSIIDYGIGAPSICAARYVASTLLPHGDEWPPYAFCSAVGAGMSAIGIYHGGALGGSAEWLQEGVRRMREQSKSAEQVAEELAKEIKERGERIQGFGHPHHKVDPRYVKLLELAERYGVAGDHCKLVQAMEKVLEKVIGRKLPANADSALAAILSDLGFDSKMCYGIFAIARCPGLVAHVYEEMTKNAPFRVPPLETVCYRGPTERRLPTDRSNEERK
jgi:citrate synthase